MAEHYNDVLARLQETWDAVDVDTEVYAEKLQIPGNYNAVIVDVSFKLIKDSSGIERHKIVWNLKVIDGEHKGKTAPTMFTGLEGRDLEWTKKNLARLESIPTNIMDLEDTLSSLSGLTIEIEIKESIKNSKSYYNTYINRLLGVMEKPVAKPKSDSLPLPEASKDPF